MAILRMRRLATRMTQAQCMRHTVLLQCSCRQPDVTYIDQDLGRSSSAASRSSTRGLGLLVEEASRGHRGPSRLDRSTYQGLSGDNGYAARTENSEVAVEIQWF